MSTRNMTRSIATAARRFGLCGLALVFSTACTTDGARSVGPGQAFATPEDAVRALAEIAGTGDFARTDAILGKGSFELLRSGDDVADREDALRVKGMIEEKVAFEDVGDDRKIALLGAEAWPFAIPLVRDGRGWVFDVASGQEEIANRRVGRNELLTIAALHSLVDAQREYHSVGRDGNPPAYARKVMSDEGRRDGLYWPVGPGEPESPFGPVVAEAAAQGYGKGEGEPAAFHGYFYHVLHAQGPNAPGGARDYLDASGLLTGGFAAVAWPARYGTSGVKTFVVSQRGVVYEKDLGDDTERIAQAMKLFDPDASWEPVGD